MTNLLIISHTPHYMQNGVVVGWGPTVREIDYLAGIFEKVLHLAILHDDTAPESSLSYFAPNVEFIPLFHAGGQSLVDKLQIAKKIPGYLSKIHQSVSNLHPTDIVHVRCPAAISLVSLFYLMFRKKPSCRWFKYAGNWAPPQKDYWSYRLQRWLLNRGYGQGLVTINGYWEGQPSHVHSFLNPCITLEEYNQASRMAESKILELPLKLLFVGRLDEEKGIWQNLEIVQKLTIKKIPVQLILIGDGPLRQRYEKWVEIHGLDDRIKFLGWLPRSKLSEYYAMAHIFLFPSKTEGWPKVLSEAMAYGAVPVASAVSSIPQILAAFNVGAALPPTDIDAFVDAIQTYLNDPDRWARESRAGVAAASHFTYDVYLDKLKELFKSNWDLDIESS